MAPRQEREKSRFFGAAYSGNLSLLKQLAKEFDNGEGLTKTFESVKNEKERTALHFAAAGGASEVCEYLAIKMKLDVNMRDKNGYTAVHHAVLGGHLWTIRYLVQVGADISLSDVKGCTPLHFAAEEGNTKILEFLISKGANVDPMAESGTPLHKATANGKKDAVKVLLSHNANPDSVIHHFFTPLLTSIVAESFECLELLLKVGADPNIGACGVTHLGHAAGMRKAKMVECLLKYGADPNAGGSSGLTPLEYAALNLDIKIMMMLFPVTARIESYPDWSIDGIVKHIRSSEAIEQRLKEGLLEWKENGKDAFQRKDYLNAIFWYTKAIVVSPIDETLFSNRSLCWACLNEFDNALSDAVMCVSLKPNWSKAHYREGAALKLLKNYRSAVEAFGKALYLDPDNKQIEKELRETADMVGRD